MNLVMQVQHHREQANLHINELVRLYAESGNPSYLEQRLDDALFSILTTAHKASRRIPPTLPPYG